MIKLWILIFSALFFSNFFLIESSAKTQLKKTDEIRCFYMYEKFKKMGEDNLRKRYPAYPIMDICLKLYHDPNWVTGIKNLNYGMSFDSIYSNFRIMPR